MPCIPSARVLTGLYPEAKAAIVTELVNQEVILLATKMPLVPRHEDAVQPLDRSNIAVWVWFQLSAFAVGVVQMTGDGNMAYEGLGPFY